MICASRVVPSVTTTSACVSPRVNSAEPCVRGSTPTRTVIGRTSSSLRPSMRMLGLEHAVAQRVVFEFAEFLGEVGGVPALRFGLAP